MSTTSSGRDTASRALTPPTQPTEQQGQELPIPPVLSVVPDSLTTLTSSTLLAAAIPASPVIAMPVQTGDASYTPPTLLSLSAEILHSIAAELRASGDRSALYNLCLTSKVLRDVAQVSLFNMFKLSEPLLDDDYCDYCGGINRDNQANIDLILFARAVFGRKDLAAGINSINLDFRNIFKARLPRLNTNDKALFSRIFKALYPQITDWETILNHRKTYGLLGLLLTGLQNMRRITFSALSHASVKDLFFFSPLSIHTVQFMFPTLRYVLVCGIPVDIYLREDPGPDLSDFAMFLAMPTLQEFHIDEFRLHKWRNPFVDSAPYSWQLPHLRLQSCVSIGPQQFEKMISSFSNLEFLEFTSEYDRWTGHYERGIDYQGSIEPEAFKSAIECQAQSLKYLDIDLTKNLYDQESIGYSKEPSTLTFGSMYQFEKLEELRVDAVRIG